MRQPAEWMTAADDRILEVMEDEGNMTPLALSREGRQPRIDLSPDWAGQRCRKLAEYGLVDALEKGLYGITDDGLAYLDGDLDATELESADDDQ